MLGTRSTLLAGASVLALRPSGVLVSFSSLADDLQVVWLSPPGSQLLVVSSNLNKLFEYFQKDFIYWTSISLCIRAVCPLLHLNRLSVTTRLSAAAREASLWPVNVFPQWGMVLVVIRKNFRWAETTVSTSAAVFWGLQLCRHQCEGMGWGMNFQHVSSSMVAGAVSVCLTSEISVSEREVLCVYQGGCGVKATQAATLKYLIHWT